jgi:pyruvate dehydrogenase E2 component (dihydrolipoyllysine-residue acetyltransferase)
MGQVRDIVVPDIGSSDDVDVIEVLVAPGDSISKEDALITLEGDKATMDVPSPAAGVVSEVKVAVGDKVSTGSLILTLDEAGSAATDDIKVEKKAPLEDKPAQTKAAPVAVPAPAAPKPASATTGKTVVVAQPTGAVHAGPAVRRLANELGVDINAVSGTGRKGRITKEDLQQFVKQQLVQAKQGGGGLGVAPMPEIDFSRYGDIEQVALNKIKRLTGTNVHRSWVTVPHVTQFDEADITELEAFRQENKADAQAQGFKLTPLVFIMKAVVKALQAFPNFNSSLAPGGETLILKKYFHVGVAVDTPNGLVVPVVRDVDQKSLFQLAKELGEVSQKARDKKLMPKDMEGSCITISSLGGISGTAFTPIVNAPDVAILGLSKSKMVPVYQHGEFVPRLMLPLSLSYDHRVIDGAEGARFTQYLAKQLSDIRRLLL